MSSGCAEANRTLIRSLKEDTYGVELLEQTVADAKLGRMSHPVPGGPILLAVVSRRARYLRLPAEQCDLDSVRLHPRFSVEQGFKTDGSRKIRAVDHFSWSPGASKNKGKRKRGSVNGHTCLPEKVRHDHVDDLMAAVMMFLRCGHSLRSTALSLFLTISLLQDIRKSTGTLESRHQGRVSQDTIAC